MWLLATDGMLPTHTKNNPIKTTMKKTIATIVSVMMMLPALAQTEHAFSISKNMDIFNSIYRQLDLFYVDSIDADKLFKVGIDAMLAELDPYTNYYPEENMKDLKMMTTGKYGGIGSVIRQRRDSTGVMIYEPYPDMPAAEAGLKVGDIMLKIDGKDLKGLGTSEVSDLLRGEPGTTFLLKVQRPGEKKAREYKITRRNIKRGAVPFYGMVKGVGYIGLTEFTEECSKDVRKAFISLKEKGAKSIVLDLRNNHGGLLSEAVDIVNLFVPKDVKIVETKGKIAAASSQYVTRNEPLDLDIPIAVLVNEETASAAEIVSGALQDLDRAVIVGCKTFGKGLVQSPRDLPYNGSIKMTTAKYYIPSGRCIQAIDYKKERQAAEVYRETGKKISTKDSVTHQIFHTAGGREGTEGSGVKPDIVLEHDTIANIVYYLSDADVLVDWGTAYCQAHPVIPAVSDFALTDDDYEAFKKMVKESGFKYDKMSSKKLEDLKKVAKFEGYYDDAKELFDSLESKLEHNVDKDMDRKKADIMKLLSMEIVRRAYFQAGTAEEALKDDKDFDEAVRVLGDADLYGKTLGKK